MRRMLLYLSTGSNAHVSSLSASEYYARLPYGHAAVLYHLCQQGWEIKRLGIREVWNPWLLACYVRAWSPDVIFTNGAIGLIPLLLRTFSPWSKIPLVHAWDDFYEDIWRANFGWLGGRLMRVLERHIICGSDAVITISRYNYRRAEAWGKKTWHIPNGCDVPVYDVARCSIRLEGELKLVYCGDQGRYKRTHEIIEAMNRVPPGVRLYMVGTPNLVLQASAPANVVFLGRLSENDKWSVMSQADVLVCTANTDCNAKFHEYLRMGKPILAYDGIPNYLFTNRRNALLSRDYPAAIMELLHSPELRRTLAENAARDIPVYTWREIAAQYDQAFEEILSCPSRIA